MRSSSSLAVVVALVLGHASVAQAKRPRQRTTRLASTYGTSSFAVVHNPSGVPSLNPDYYVSTAGSDTTGTGTLASPWATLQHAVLATRGATSAQRSDRVVHLAPGVYQQTAASFTPQDSGGNGNYVRYKCDGDVVNSPCELWGGKTVTGWSTYSGNISRAAVTPGVRINTLYENGKRAMVARYPNYVYDPLYPTAKAPYLYTADTVTGGQATMKYSTGDIDPSTWGDLTGLQVYAWPGDVWIWYTDVMAVTVDTTAHTFTPERLFTMPIYQNGWGSRYFVQNLLTFLDAPGEWYQDVAGGWLYYYPRDGAIGSQQIVIPTTQRVISLVGTGENGRVSHVVFDGLTVKFSDFLNRYTLGCTPQFHFADPTQQLLAPCNATHTVAPVFNFYYEPQPQWQALIYGENVDNITIQNSHLANSGTSGVYMREYAQNVTIANNWINRVAHSGVYFQGNYPGEGDVNRNNTVQYNIIDTYGEIVGNGQGIIQQTSGHNLISHNEVFNGPRDALYTNGGSDSMNLPGSGGCQSCIYTNGTTYEYMRLHDAGEDSSDMGILGMFSLNSEPGTGGPYVSNTFNQISMYGGYQHPSTKQALIEGLFTDNRTAGQVISNAESTDIETGYLAKYNESGEHTLTNVSWDPTVTGGTGQYNISTANGSFSAAAMDYVNIGCPNTMPWFAQAKAAWDFSDSFESGLGAWTTASGTPATSTTQAHTGTHSFAVNQNGEVIYKTLETRRRGTVSVWMYDDATVTTLSALAAVEQAQLSTQDSSGTWATWNNPKARALGVDTSASTTKYVYRTEGGSVATSVTRTTGWHQFTWDYTSGTGVTMKVDGTTVASNLAGVRTFDVVALGNFSGTAGTVYWDDVSVVDQ